MVRGGAFLKFLTTFIYGLAFGCSAIILGIYSFFLAVRAENGVAIPMVLEAIVGMSGVGVIYTLFALFLTCCLGAIRFFAFLGILFDFLLMGAFVAIAILTRDGATTCTGNMVKSPLGNGPADQQSNAGGNGPGSSQGITGTLSTSLGFACTLNTAVFAVSIIGAFFFLLASYVQLRLGRARQREKRYGANPETIYPDTEKSGFFGKGKKSGSYLAKEEEGPFVNSGVTPQNLRDSTYTTSTLDQNNGTYIGNKYESRPPNHVITTTGAYDDESFGAGVNPYGYDNRADRVGTNPYNYESRTETDPYNYNSGRPERNLYGYENRF